MSTSKEAWELAWRQEFPNAARVAHYDGVAAAKRCGFEAGYLAATKLSPSPAGSVRLDGDAEAPTPDSPTLALAGTPGGLSELEAIQVLDAWAIKHGYSVPQVQRESARPKPGEEWVVFVRVGDERAWFNGATPAEARHKAAAALLAEDPELFRKD